MNLSPVSQTGFIYIILHKETSHLSFFLLITTLFALRVLQP